MIETNGQEPQAGRTTVSIDKAVSVVGLVRRTHSCGR